MFMMGIINYTSIDKMIENTYEKEIYLVLKSIGFIAV